MLIDQFISLLQEAAELPFFRWRHNFLLIRKSFIDDLRPIYLSLENTKVPSAKKLSAFIKLLEKDDPEELTLAKGFVLLGEVFSTSAVEDDQIKKYLLLADSFLARVKKERIFTKVRNEKRKKLSAEEQSEHDRKLFHQEGLNYCLIYYLAHYRALSGLKDKNQKNAYIDQLEVNFGTGKIMGIKQDFIHDECLEKFIYFIFNDDLRNQLLEKYYYCKPIIIPAKSFIVVEAALHNFIFEMLKLFDQQGVAAADNGFWAPYGQKAPIKDLITLFSRKYVPEI